MSQREDSFEGKAAMEALRSARGSLVVVTDLYEHRTLQEAAIYAGRAAGVSHQMAFPDPVVSA